MKSKQVHGAKKTSTNTVNTLETLKNLGSGVAHDAASNVGKIGSGMLDQLAGNFNDYDDDFYGYDDEQFYQPKEKAAPAPAPQKEFTVFNAAEYNEQQKITSEIHALTSEIKKGILEVKRAEAELLNEVKDVEKITINAMPEKPGIYDIRFLELVIELLRSIKLKIGESKTWLQAMMSKKKKRGSLFAHNAKKKGTQYSLSQELQSARSIQ